MRRRDFLAAPAVAALQEPAAVLIDPAPRFEVSPWLYMQFMEPLGVTDSSVEAAWDYEQDDWRKSFVAATRDLGPQVLRWGGLYSRYYRWREGVGPAAQRPWMRNYVWGGKETNRVGTGEFVDLCRRVGAEPLMCVNFEGDGEARYRNTKEGDRTAGVQEAAEWVSYANDPSDRLRRSHGIAEPLGIRLWQLGNETSYGNATFSKDQSIAKTIEFARAMRARDKSVQLIGWGDRGREGYWAPDLVARAGEWIDLVAFHMMGQSPQRKDTVLRAPRYQREPEQAWTELLELAARQERRLGEMIDAAGREKGVAITEGHLSLPPHNANPLLLEWMTAVYHARSLNAYLRRGDRVKIATIADFEGNRWTVNAMLLQVPGGACYLTPAGAVARLFRHHTGAHGVSLGNLPEGLDAVATRSANKVFVHAVNTAYGRAVEASFAVRGMKVSGGRVFQIAPQDLRTMAVADAPDAFSSVEAALPATARWRFPAGAVAAVELELA
ncbi:MAG: alpha-L-arabinofuranosidase [Acidobacteria bacterium]|nr:alpha-L-arabinofuranosidase [Acidobacteriota bacterium]